VYGWYLIVEHRFTIDFSMDLHCKAVVSLWLLKVYGNHITIEHTFITDFSTHLHLEVTTVVALKGMGQN
jgi:hypothetical protein